jgi:hypothetical protein
MKRTRSGTVKTVDSVREKAAVDEIDHLGEEQQRAISKRSRLAERDTRCASPFDSLPDELVLAVTMSLLDAKALVAWSLTSRHHYALSMESCVWRHLYQAHFGTPLHVRPAAHGKEWRWLYRARACDGKLPGITVGRVEIVFTDTKTPCVYWGDLIDGAPDGYGLAAALKSDWRPDKGADGARPVAGFDASAVDASDTYEGMWKCGQTHGYGVRIHPDGQRYAGEYANDRRNGHGTYTWPSGSHYTGEWRDHYSDGCGVYTWPSGARYDGQWRKDRQHGLGTYVGSHGTIYKGHYKKGLRHGAGINVEDDGTRFVGRFKRGRLDGFGFCLWPDGSWYNGGWKANNAQGFGAAGEIDGSKYNGEYEEGERHGYGICSYPDGSNLRGQWTHGTCTVVERIEHGPREIPCVIDTSACMACINGHAE